MYFFIKAKSPVFCQMTSTILGITTIRASNMALELTNEFDELQNIHSGVWQTLQSINTGMYICLNSNIFNTWLHRLIFVLKTALGLWLDCISSTFVGLICYSFIATSDETSSSKAGLAISQALVLTGMVNWI